MRVRIRAADSMLNPLGLGGFSLLQALSTENDRPESACRPFDRTRQGTVLGEGAAFLVLEEEGRARARGARILARIRGCAFGTVDEASDPAETLQRIFARLAPHTDVALISAEEGDGRICTLEERTFDACGVRPGPALRPKAQLGNLFAAAAAVQVALAAAWAKRAGSGCEVLANCFGHGSEKAAFLMDGV